MYFSFSGFLPPFDLPHYNYVSGHTPLFFGKYTIELRALTVFYCIFDFVILLRMGLIRATWSIGLAV